MTKGLYFYKLVSPYCEDITKDCKLTINEIDSNFISLKDMDIKDLTFNKETNKIILTRNSKDEPQLVADLSPLADGIVHDLSVEYDRAKGEIKITWDGKTTVIDGLITKENINCSMLTQVNSDSTLMGLGTTKKPLGINVVDRTGQFRPAKRYVDMVGGEILPSPCALAVGDRFVTREYVSDYGYLYDFKGVKKMEEDLKCGWRVPSKEDWDDMLNAVEPCDIDRTHANTICNRELGKLAGKLLKANGRWEGDIIPSGDCECESAMCQCIKDEEFDCIDDNEYHYHKEQCFEHHPKRKPIDPRGVDLYHLALLPAGYGDGCEFKDYYGKRGMFWTSTMFTNTDVYAKRFDYNKSGVVQIAANPHDIMSVRLVKDYDGSNFNEVELINGQMFTCVLMPSLTSETGFAIWTSNNVAFSDCKYEPKEVEVHTEEFRIQLFTAEWNGTNWIKKPLNEGEDVVLFEGRDDDEYVTYRVIDGEFVSVSSQIYDDIYAKFEKVIGQIQLVIEEEVTERIEADEALSGAIEDLRSEITSGSTDVKEQISQLSGEVVNIYNTIENVYTDITTISGSVQEVQDSLSAETEERIAADEVLSGAVEELKEIISGGSQDTKEAIAALSATLETEIEERIAVDEELSGSVETVAEGLESETERATAKENEIENRLISHGEYESVEGVLTLFTESGSTIEIQFNGNYGNF